MAKKQNWQDDYWMLLMQVYQKKPVGVKPLFARQMVDLGIELHISPQTLHAKMCELDRIDSPRINRLWEEYGLNPQRLNRAVKLLRRMTGFGNSDAFYEGVDTQETFEQDFRPLAADPTLTPVMLILILDLYFRLTPITQVAETPEIQQLARLMKTPAEKVVQVMEVFQHCDPYLNRRDHVASPLLSVCQDTWKQYGNGDTEQLSQYAEQLKEYFR